MPWLATLLVLAGFVTLELCRLDHFAWSDDEAVLVLTAQAVQHGGRLYDEVWFNYPPGFLQLLNVAFAIGGFSLKTARIAVLSCALMALLLVAGLSRSVGSSWSGVLSVLMLATAPHFLVLSGAAMTEVPAIASAVGAVWAALAYHRTGRHLWLALSSVAFAASVWIKPTMLPTGVVPLLALWLTEETARRRLTSAVAFGALTALILGTGLLAHNPAGFFRQLVLTYVRSRAAFELELRKNAYDIVQYFLNDKYQLTHASLLLLGGCGWCTLRRHGRTEAILLLAWPLAIAAVLLLHAPLYRHHLVQLLVPITVLAGLGWERVISTLRRPHRPVAMALLCVLLVISVVELGLCLRVALVSLPSFEADNAESGEEAVRYIREATRPDEWVITDAHIIALKAGRPIPPQLTNTSRMRIETGQLTSQQMIDIARRLQPGAIVFWERKLDLLEDFVSWVNCHYDLTAYFRERHRIYQPYQLVTDEDVSLPLGVRFGEGICLVGYSVSAPSVNAGAVIQLTLYWRATVPLQDDFTVFAQLVDRQGVIVGQNDGAPSDGACPTSVWQPEEIITDSRAVDVDRSSAGGPYRFLVGLYRADGRLPAFDSQGNGLLHNQVVLGLPPEDGEYRPDIATPQCQQEAYLGDYVKLMGFDLADASIQRGEALSLILYWQCLKKMTTSYTVFIHLLDQQGKIVCQQDVLPEGGEFPTVGWVPGAVIVDHHLLPLPQDLLAGRYQIEVGMYDGSSSERLPISDAAGREMEFDRMLLDTPIQVDQP